MGRTCASTFRRRQRALTGPATTPIHSTSAPSRAIWVPRTTPCGTAWPSPAIGAPSSGAANSRSASRWQRSVGNQLDDRRDVTLERYARQHSWTMPSTTQRPAPGDHFIDFELPDHNGNRRRLSELIGGDPTILQFYRGFWCPNDPASYPR